MFNVISLYLRHLLFCKAMSKESYLIIEKTKDISSNMLCLRLRQCKMVIKIRDINMFEANTIYLHHILCSCKVKSKEPSTIIEGIKHICTKNCDF